MSGRHRDVGLATGMDPRVGAALLALGLLLLGAGLWTQLGLAAFLPGLVLASAGGTVLAAALDDLS